MQKSDFMHFGKWPTSNFWFSGIHAWPNPRLPIKSRYTYFLKFKNIFFSMLRLSSWIQKSFFWRCFPEYRVVVRLPEQNEKFRRKRLSKTSSRPLAQKVQGELDQVGGRGGRVVEFPTEQVLSQIFVWFRPYLLHRVPSSHNYNSVI